MGQCVFCDIIARQAPGSLVWEDEQTVAFLDIHQPNPYKVLVVPCDHVEQIYDLTEMQAATLMQTAVTVAQAIRDVSQCEGLRLFQNNGAVAGQDVFHVHIHLLPRFAQDHYPWGTNYPARSVLDQLAADLRAALPK